MIGQGENRWRYAFDCKECMNKRIQNGATYCIPLSTGHGDVMEAGDDYVVRCSGFKAGQMDLFDTGDS